MGSEIKNIIGTKYGKLTILKELAPDFDSWNRKIRKVECECECGKKRITKLSSLRYGSCKSCGCALKERKPHSKHNLCNTPEYRTYYGMKGRCLNPNHYEYKRYGAKGIKVYEKWLNDFTQFLEYVGKKPSKEYSLDRIDPTGNYEPGNVRWATPREQRINQIRMKQQ